MNRFLLDTNVLSELSRPRPDRNVYAWLDQQYRSDLCLSVISLAEIIRGIKRQKDPMRRAHLEAWFPGTFKVWFAEEPLPLTRSIAERLGYLLASREDAGRPVTFPDAAIAATALEHDLVLVTRNIPDFERTGLPLLNPWEVDATGSWKIL